MLTPPDLLSISFTLEQIDTKHTISIKTELITILVSLQELLLAKRCYHRQRGREGGLVGWLVNNINQTGKSQSKIGILD